MPPHVVASEFPVPDDADYVLEVMHLILAGGPSEVYRVTVTPTVPDFDLVLPIERFELSPGRISQLRREFRDGWERFCGAGEEAVPA